MVEFRNDDCRSLRWSRAGSASITLSHSRDSTTIEANACDGNQEPNHLRITGMITMLKDQRVLSGALWWSMQLGTRKA